MLHDKPGGRDSRVVVGAMGAIILTGEDRKAAEETIRAHHYTHGVPAGKSHYVQFEAALVVWSIPANKNLAKFVLGQEGNLWELSRLWAPDGHEPNLLTRAISAAVREIKRLENPDVLISYADPNAGHEGYVYRAASWIKFGASGETRMYVDINGQRYSRRCFHSGGRGMTKAEIEALGFKQEHTIGKHRYVKPLSRIAKRKFRP